VFELNRLHGLRYAEVAAALGVSVKAVEAQMGRALKALREQMAPWIEER
jgi:RNA polymerase sigma-70 factor (ECF subfamily)